MADPRLERMAETLVHYSAGVRRGDIVRILGGTEAAPLIREVYRACLERGAHPYTQVGVPGLEETFFEKAGRAQLSSPQPIFPAEVCAFPPGWTHASQGPCPSWRPS